MSLGPEVLGTTVEEAPKEQPQEMAPVQKEEVVEKAIEAPQEQPKLPEKFKSVEDMVRSYEHAESELTRQRQINRELEQRIGQAQQKVESEDEIFRKEWEQDPQAAVYNRTLRTEAKLRNQLAESNAQMFYKSAMNDEVNYPGFKELEPKMVELANQYGSLVHPSMLQSPQVIDLLYKLAVGTSAGSQLAKAKIAGQKEAESRRKEVSSAAFESPTPASASVTRPEDMTLEQLEKQIGFVQR